MAKQTEYDLLLIDFEEREADGQIPEAHAFALFGYIFAKYEDKLITLDELTALTKRLPLKSHQIDDLAF